MIKIRKEKEDLSYCVLGYLDLSRLKGKSQLF